MRFLDTAITSPRFHSSWLPRSTTKNPLQRTLLGLQFPIVLIDFAAMEITRKRLVTAINRRLSRDRREITKKPKTDIYRLLDVDTGKITLIHESELEQFARKIGLAIETSRKAWQRTIRTLPEFLIVNGVPMKPGDYRSPGQA
jgi:hypothetical protein